jgi:hypothetical protein
MRPESDHVAAMGGRRRQTRRLSRLIASRRYRDSTEHAPRPILSVLHIPVSWVKSIKGEIILVYSVVLKPKKPQAEMTCRKYLTNTA